MKWILLEHLPSRVLAFSDPSWQAACPPPAPADTPLKRRRRAPEGVCKEYLGGSESPRPRERAYSNARKRLSRLRNVRALFGTSAQLVGAQNRRRIGSWPRCSRGSGPGSATRPILASALQTDGERSFSAARRSRDSVSRRDSK